MKMITDPKAKQIANRARETWRSYQRNPNESYYGQTMAYLTTLYILRGDNTHPRLMIIHQSIFAKKLAIMFNNKMTQIYREDIKRDIDSDFNREPR